MEHQHIADLPILAKVLLGTFAWSSLILILYFGRKIGQHIKKGD